MRRTRRTVKLQARQKARGTRKSEPRERAILPVAKPLLAEISRLGIAASSCARANAGHAEALLERQREALNLLAQLIQYSAPPLTSFLVKKQLTLAMAARNALIDRGAADKRSANKAVEHALRKPPGRPVVARFLAAEALGLHDEKKWQAIANRLQPSDFPEYGQSFLRRLTREVTRLRHLRKQIEAFLKES